MWDPGEYREGKIRVSTGSWIGRAPTMVDPAPDDPVDGELVPSSLTPIVPILRVANEVQDKNPRVAYLCRFHAFEKAHKMDPTSKGHSVRQFKTYLLHRLEREEEDTQLLVERNDSREIQKFYQKFYENNIKEGQHTKKPEELAKNYQIATVLYDVLKTVVPAQKVEALTEEYAKEVEKKRKQFEHYNILPFYTLGIKSPIMELPEMKAAIQALHRVENLPMPRNRLTPSSPDDNSIMLEDRDKPFTDILDWLSSIFGFQKGNVANQREHLVMLLANLDVRNKNLDDTTRKKAFSRGHRPRLKVVYNAAIKYSCG